MKDNYNLKKSYFFSFYNISVPEKLSKDGAGTGTGGAALFRG